MKHRLVVSVYYIRINEQVITQDQGFESPPRNIYFNTMYDLYHIIRDYRYHLN